MNDKLKVESGELNGIRRLLISDLMELWGVSRQVAQRKATRYRIQSEKEEKPGGGYRNVYLVPEEDMVRLGLTTSTTAPTAPTAPTATDATPSDRGRGVIHCWLPSLRTVRAVLPHTALQKTGFSFKRPA